MQDVEQQSHKQLGQDVEQEDNNDVDGNAEIEQEVDHRSSDPAPSLDALLSPHTSSSSEQLTTPVSLDHDGPILDLADVPINDAFSDGDGETEGRFSTISLSASQLSKSKSISSIIGLKSPGSSVEEIALDEDVDGELLNGLSEASGKDIRRRTMSLVNGNISTASSSTILKSAMLGHRKSRSISADGTKAGTMNGSAHLPFLLQRLDVQKVREEDGRYQETKRGSQDGQAKLLGEFERLQKEEKEKVLSSSTSGDATTVSASSSAASTSTSAANEQIDWDFWGAVMADYRQYASDNPDALAKAIERGIPSSLRGMMWQLMAASKDAELEATYLRLLKETSPHEKAILRDLGRTFPHHEFFTDGQGIGQENLFNVLKAYSLHDPQVGYCQGLPFVVAVLLLNMPDEEAFCLLVRLMQSYDLRGHFLPEMPGLQMRLFQFDRLLEELLPVLHVHFLRQGLKSSMFCSQWYLTMFSYRFPLDIVFRIYDNVLATGIEAIFAFSIVLLQKNEETLLKLKFDEILTFLKNRLFEQYIIPSSEPSTSESSVDIDKSNHSDRSHKLKVDEFVRDAVNVKITPFMLDLYAHEYEELVRTREAHAVEMDTLRNANRQLAARVNSLEAEMAQVNQEQVEVLKELVMTRLRNEEMEGELVKYKLLYADAMHQSADAMSSHRLSSPVKQMRIDSNASSNSSRT